MPAHVAGVLALAVGCGGPRYQMQVVGQGTAPVLARSAAAVAPDVTTAPGGGGFALEAGAYEVNLHFAIPRAQVIDWHVRCEDGTVADGSVGETLEAYKERRARELRAERDRVAGATSAVVGAFAPRVGAGARSPNGSAQVEAGVDADAVGGAAAANVDVIVPAWDVGGGAVEAKTGFTLGAASTCAIHAVGEDQTVVASYQLVKRRDLHAERDEAKRIAAAGAVDVRGRVRAQLVAHGAEEHPAAPVVVVAPPAVAPPLAASSIEHTVAVSAEVAPAPVIAVPPPPPDPRRDAAFAVRLKIISKLRADFFAQKELEAEREHARGRQLAAQAELDLRARAELDAKVTARAALEASWTAEAQRRRTLILDRLIAIGADPGRRARLAAEAAAAAQIRLDAEASAALELQRRRDAELAIRLDAEARATADREAAANLRAQQAHAEAAIRQQRVDAALGVRLRLRAHLVARGAIERPPMPAPMPEDPGSQPFDGAIWVAGEWHWTGATWEWTVGGWTDAGTFADAGSADNPPSRAVAPAVVPTVVEGSVAGSGTVTIEVPTTVTVEGPAVTPPPVPSPGPTVVIPVGISVEVNAPRPAPRQAPRPVVRDHRQPSRRPVVRDHRKR